MPNPQDLFGINTVFPIPIGPGGPHQVTVPSPPPQSQFGIMPVAGQNPLNLTSDAGFIGVIGITPPGLRPDMPMPGTAGPLDPTKKQPPPGIINNPLLNILFPGFGTPGQPGVGGSPGGSGGGGGCFPAGTLILMADGTDKPIEEVRDKDMVMGRDIDGERNVMVECVEVEAPVTDHLYELEFADGSVLKTTMDHPIYTQRGWAAISPDEALKRSNLWPVALEIGSRCLKNDGTWHTLTVMTYVQGRHQLYNLRKVAGFRNFYANGFLVHNKANPQ